MNAPIPLDWLPRLPRRYAATAVDGLLVLAVFLFSFVVFPGEGDAARWTRILLTMVALFLYEPIATGRFVSVGQLVAGVRVCRDRDGARIGIFRAWLRLLLKAVLGIVSFLILPFTPGRRCLHDLATGSIVLTAAGAHGYRAIRTVPAEITPQEPSPVAS